MRNLVAGLTLLVSACVSTPYYLPNTAPAEGEHLDKWKRSTDYDLRAMGESPLYGRTLKANESAHIRVLIRPSFRPDHAIHLVSYKNGNAVARLKQLGYKPNSSIIAGRWNDIGLIHTDNVSVSEKDVETIRIALSRFENDDWTYPDNPNRKSGMYPAERNRTVVVCVDGESYILEVLDLSGYRYLEDHRCKFDLKPQFAIAVNTLKDLLPTSEPPW